MASIKTAIELTDGEARVLQVKLGKDRQVKAAVKIPLPLPAQLEPATRLKVRAAAFRDGLRASGIRIHSAVMIIPKRKGTLRYAVLPSADDAELSKMAKFEAERHIPFNVQRHVVSFAVMQKDALQGSRVLLAAVDGPELEEAVAFAAAAGFDIEGIDLSSLGHFNVLASQASEELLTQTVGHLHVGLYGAEIGIVSNGLLLFSRSVPYGVERLLNELREALPAAKNITATDLRSIDLMQPEAGLNALGLSETSASLDEENSVVVPAKSHPARSAETVLRDWLNNLSIQIQRSYEFAQRELECSPISSLVVSGEASMWQNFGEFIQSGFNVPTQNLTSLEGLEHTGVGIEETQPFLAATGALSKNWRPGALSVNLLPPSYRAKGAIQKKRQSIAVTAVLALSVVLLGYLYMRIAGDLKREQIESLKRTNAELAPLADELVDREKQLSIISDFRNDKRSALAILDTISSKDYFPRRASLTRFEYNKGDIVTFQGLAVTIQDLTQFEIDLREAMFQNERIFRGGVIKKQQEFGFALPGRTETLMKFVIEGKLSRDD